MKADKGGRGRTLRSAGAGIEVEAGGLDPEDRLINAIAQ